MDIANKVKEKGATLVDVREPLELWLSKIDEAVNIPLSKLPSKVEAVRSMSKPVIVFCRSGNRSNQAMKILKEQGIDEIYNGGSITDVKAMYQYQ